MCITQKFLELEKKIETEFKKLAPSNKTINIARDWFGGDVEGSEGMDDGEFNDALQQNGAAGDLPSITIRSRSSGLPYDGNLFKVDKGVIYLINVNDRTKLQGFYLSDVESLDDKVNLIGILKG